MIKTKKITRPSDLDTTARLAEIEQGKASIREKLARNEALREGDLKPLWRQVSSIKENLFELNHGKCAYCEAKERAKRTMDIEHFRPKLGVTEDTEHTGYWWLANNPDNFLLSCKVCNSDHKGNHFPILSGNRAVNETDNVDAELKTLVNPDHEDPENFINFVFKEDPLSIAIPVGIDPAGRGHATIKICGLDDDDLNQWRGESISVMRSLAVRMLLAREQNNTLIIPALAKNIFDYTKSDKQFAGFRRAFFVSQGLGEYIAKD